MSEDSKKCGSKECTSSSCEGCGKNPESLLEETNEFNSIKKVIGVVSGKGGVGKSLVTAMLAVMMNRKGYSVGVLDADITGPSVPKMFGVSKKASGNQYGVLPERSKQGIEIMSINLLLEDEENPVIWRGPVISGTVKQFWTNVLWGELDLLFIDMPPGTGDVPLTVFQSIPVDGIVIVTSPQDLVSMIVKKAYNMARQMNIPVLGIVENMSFVKCPECGREISIFGESKLFGTAGELGLDILGRMPIDPALAKLCDSGEIEGFEADYLPDAAKRMEGLL
jgi:Mrp family chromosome partitioning ATPase